MVPILVTIALLAASMRYLGVQFNAITGTVLSIGIGLGIDYSAHLVHRISEEYRQAADLFDALTVSVVGTGGALTGSMSARAVRPAHRAQRAVLVPHHTADPPLRGGHVGQRVGGVRPSPAYV
jgi:hypothetical protein